jgi:hypothetical protein
MPKRAKGRFRRCYLRGKRFIELIDVQDEGSRMGAYPVHNSLAVFARWCGRTPRYPRSRGGHTYFSKQILEDHDSGR